MAATDFELDQHAKETEWNTFLKVALSFAINGRLRQILNAMIFFGGGGQVSVLRERPSYG